MLKKNWFILFIVLASLAFSVNATAQASREAEPADRSELAVTELPPGGERVPEDSVPEDVKKTLARLVAAGGEKIRQGNSEVLTWSGSGYKKSTAVQLMKKVEENLQNSGWTFEVGERNNEFVVFSLFRQQPERRLLFGFFVPSNDGLVLALTEMVRADAPSVAEANNVPSDEPAAESKSGVISPNPSAARELFGKWAYARTGSSISNAYGQAIASNGSRITYEFFSNGTVEFVGIMHTASLAGCRLEAFSTKKGKVSINGDRMTISWAPTSFSRDDTCTPQQNYKKTLPAETETNTWQIKHEAHDRTLLCLQSKDGETCLDKSQ
jgi:hypothetical protein